jgi:DNA invertase Pin-like site-specific DNA recombinase
MRTFIDLDLQESWLDTSDEGMGQLLIAIFSWIAKQERQRISERTKAGLSRENGYPMERANDKKIIFCTKKNNTLNR